MPILSRTYNTVPGGHNLFHYSLYGVTILGVEREGTGQTQVAFVVTPTNREFSYFGSQLYFDANIPFAPGEKVWVLYQT